jgi:hypothetical protein
MMYTEKRHKKMEKRRETMVNPLSSSFLVFSQRDFNEDYGLLG